MVLLWHPSEEPSSVPDGTSMVLCVGVIRCCRGMIYPLCGNEREKSESIYITLNKRRFLLVPPGSPLKGTCRAPPLSHSSCNLFFSRKQSNSRPPRKSSFPAVSPGDPSAPLFSRLIFRPRSCFSVCFSS